MRDAFELAGYVAGEAIFTLSQGEEDPLVPIYGFSTYDDRFAVKRAAFALFDGDEEDPLAPIYGASRHDEADVVRRMLFSDDYAETVALISHTLDSGNAKYRCTTLVHDGRMVFGDGKKYDTLTIEVRSGESSSAKAKVYIPYTPMTEHTPFKVHKPKFNPWEGARGDEFDLDACADAFFDGFELHDEGREVWVRCFDPIV